METVRSSGDDAWVVGLVGAHSERFRCVTPTPGDLETLTILDSIFTYDGNGRLLRLGLQAYALSKTRPSFPGARKKTPNDIVEQKNKRIFKWHLRYRWKESPARYFSFATKRLCWM